MNPTVKQKWVEALRSGDYQQTEKVLKHGNCFCVLGVLCGLYRIEKGIKGWGDPDYFFVGDEHEVDILPKAVVDWAGLDSQTGPMLSINHSRLLQITVFNDDMSLTFEELADAIEAQC